MSPLDIVEEAEALDLDALAEDARYATGGLTWKGPWDSAEAERRGRRALAAMSALAAEVKRLRARVAELEGTARDALADKHDVPCLCHATSEYDPPCPRHGVLGIAVTGKG